MTRPVRLGAVDYLNVRPLVHGLDGVGDLVTLRFDVPSECARLLDAGEIDLGMVPSITLANRPGDRVVPGVCIGSDGPVASVALFTRVPVDRIRRIALDTSSRTSACLTKILCARKFNIAPAFLPHRPDLGAMLAEADAALVIGDPALFVDHRAHGAEKIDLGQAWTDMTSLPFVWAFWAGRPEAASLEVVGLLQRAADEGMTRTDAIADAYVAATPERAPVARRYLRESLVFELSPRALEGLRTYYREAAALGLIASAPEVRFFGEAQRSPGGAMTPADAKTLVDYHYWARDRVLDAVAALTPEQFTQDLKNSFRSVRDTLAHTYSAEWVWHSRWNGISPTAPIPFDRFADVASLRTDWIALEGHVRSLVDGLGEIGLARELDYTMIDGTARRSAMWQMLQHVVNHASYHRGQVTTMLRQLDAQPGKSMDMIVFFRER